MRAAVAVLCALLLAGCATGGNTEGKSLAAVQDTAAGAGQAVHAAYAAGKVPKANVVKAAALEDQVDDLSLAARKAYAAGDASSAQGAIAQIVTLTAAIVALQH